jgi:ubiquinone/menaquinone biosynthesis C-methylase UbiE
MAELDKLFTGSIPEIYDRSLVPLIFEAYASDLAARVAKLAPKDVLETAAGTGALTRALELRLPANARIVATDLNQPMLDYAKRKSAGNGHITWRQADALALPFDDETFDAAACQFGVMFYPIKSRGYSEAYRVLRPGGGFFFNVWDHISQNDFADVITQGLAKFFPQDPPLFLARTPYGYHDLARIRAELTAAGFTAIAADTRVETSKASSPRDVAVAFCQGTPLRNEIEVRDSARLKEATDAAAEALERRFGRGAIDGRITAHVFTAIR